METILVLKKGEFVNRQVEELSLQELQKSVGGHIRQVPFFKELDKRDINCWVNEDGKLLNLDLTAIIFDQEENEFIDSLAGNVVFSKSENKGSGLNEEDICYIKEMFGRLAVITDMITGKKITVNVGII